MEEYGELLKNVDLKKYNTYKIGGIAKYLIKPYNIDSLIKLLNYIKQNELKYIILGNGSNVILPDEDYNGIVILLDNINEIIIKDNKVYASAGCKLSTLIKKTVDNNLKGLEKLFGIPGVLGASIYGNVGCYNTEISDYIIDVTYIDNGKIITKNKKDLEFSYRNSYFKKNKDLIIISCNLLLDKGNYNELKNIMKEIMEKRKKTQPLEYPNAGSVFKNPKNDSAGRLIESLNLKNFHINDAYISEKHANFIINKGTCTSKDIKELIKIIKEKVYEEYKIDLEQEQIEINY